MADKDAAASPIELVWGAEEIAKVIGRSARQTFHLLDTGQIPAKKVGNRWVAESGQLREFFRPVGSAA